MNFSVPPPQTSPRVKPAVGPCTPPSDSIPIITGPRTPPNNRSGKRGPRTPPLSSSKSRGPRTPSSASPSVSRSPTPRGPRTPPDIPRRGPRTPPEPRVGPRTPSSSPQSDMSGRRGDYDRRRRSGTPDSRDRSSYVSDYRTSPDSRHPPSRGYSPGARNYSPERGAVGGRHVYALDRRSPDGRSRRRHSRTPEGQDARGATPDQDSPYTGQRSHKRSKKSEWEEYSSSRKRKKSREKKKGKKNKVSLNNIISFTVLALIKYKFYR